MLIKAWIVAIVFGGASILLNTPAVAIHVLAQEHRKAMAPCVRFPLKCLGGYVIFKDTRIARIDDGTHAGPKITIDTLVKGDDAFLSSISTIVFPFEPGWFKANAAYELQSYNLTYA